jgi:hypothetical protein
LNFNKAISTVHKSNTSALTFNEKLGFIKVDENDIFLKFELHKSNFLLKFSSIVLHIEKELKCNLDISELDNFKINQFSDEGNSKKL